MKSQSTIDYRNHDRRLDHWLISIYPQTPKSHLQKLIRKGLIRVNLKKTMANYRIQSGDLITYPTPEKAPTLAEPYRRKTSLAPCIQYENDDFLIIDKPAGLPVHSGTGYDFGMVDDLEDLYGQKLYLVHRLDRLTSGIMIVAKHPVMQNTFSQMFRERDLSKIYHCVVRDWTHGEEIRVQVPLLRIRENHCDTNVVDPEGVDSISEFKLLQTYGPYSLLEVTLITGRMHQIRAHCKHLNSPIVGDDLYGKPSNHAAGMMLLAKKLSFTLDEKLHSYESAWPEVKNQWLLKHGLTYYE